MSHPCGSRPSRRGRCRSSSRTCGTRGDVAHAVDLLETAARAGAACICFPELYPRVGEAEICAAARRLGVFVVAGLIEGTRASWHNTATVIGPDGRVLGRQPKCFPTQNEIDNGVVAGKGYRVIETDIGRLGIVICADFAFFSEGVESIVEQGVDIIFNPSWWFALGEAYPGTVIGRHMQYGKPVIGVDIAACALRLPDADGRLVERFPRAGGYSTVCVPPPIASLAELAEWFRTKAGGTNAAAGLHPEPGGGRGHPLRRRGHRGRPAIPRVLLPDHESLGGRRRTARVGAIPA